MTWRVYRFDDASAPALTGQAGSVINILDACLVNGYGSRTAAGWTKAFSGTNLAAYLQGAGSAGFYARVDDTGATDARVIGYETMSDINTGTNLFPTTAQISGGVFARKSSSADAIRRPWLVVADAKRFYLWLGFLTTTTGGFAVTISQAGSVLAFGDFISRMASDPFRCFIIGNPTANTSGNFSNHWSGTVDFVASPGHFIARASTTAIGSVQASKCYSCPPVSRLVTTSMGSAGPDYPDPITGGLILSPLYLLEAGPLARGVLPGVLVPGHSFVNSSGNTFSGSTAGGLTGR